MHLCVFGFSVTVSFIDVRSRHLYVELLYVRKTAFKSPVLESPVLRCDELFRSPFSLHRWHFEENAEHCSDFYRPTLYQIHDRDIPGYVDFWTVNRQKVWSNAIMYVKKCRVNWPLDPVAPRPLYVRDAAKSCIRGRWLKLNCDNVSVYFWH